MLGHISFDESIPAANQACILEYGELCGVFRSEEAAIAEVFGNPLRARFAIASDNATGKYLLFRYVLPGVEIKAA